MNLLRFKGVCRLLITVSGVAPPLSQIDSVAVVITLQHINSVLGGVSHGKI